jgi:hypothetical protein
VRLGRCGVGEEALEAVLDERVKGRGGGIAAVDGGTAVGPERPLPMLKGPRGAAQPARVGAGVGMPTTLRR